MAIYNFGGQPSGWTLRESFLPPGWVCLVCTALQMPELPRNFVKGKKKSMSNLMRAQQKRGISWWPKDTDKSTMSAHTNPVYWWKNTHISNFRRR